MLLKAAQDALIGSLAPSAWVLAWSVMPTVSVAIAAMTPGAIARARLGIDIINKN